jgi:cytochrome c553
MTHFLKSLSLAALLVLAPAAYAGAAGVPEKAASCATCHGEGGAKPIAPTYPVLAGQYANYLEHALQEYKTGKRKNAVMAGQAAALSDAEIKALARYFAQQPGPLYTPGLHKPQ